MNDGKGVKKQSCATSENGSAVHSVVGIRVNVESEMRTLRNFGDLVGVMTVLVG